MCGHKGVLLFERIRMCGLVGGSVSMVEECEALKAYAKPRVSLFFLPIDQVGELSALSPAPCLPSCCHASHHDDNRLNL